VRPQPGPGVLRALHSIVFVYVTFCASYTSAVFLDKGCMQWLLYSQGTSTAAYASSFEDAPRKALL
jgi:hypothetical protein